MPKKAPEVVVAELIACISTQAEHDRVLERRREDVRYPFEVACPIAYRRVTGDTFVADARACTLDISRHGVGLLVHEHVEPQSIVTICLVNLGMPDTHLRAKVVSCRKLLRDVYRLGAAFVFDEPPVAPAHAAPAGE